MESLSIKGLGILLASILLALCNPNPAFGQATEEGDWNGVLATPGGDLRIVFSIVKDIDQNVVAALESVDQAPGQKIPISSFEISDERLVFAIDRIGARFEGVWNDAAGGYEGIFNQGQEFQLTLRPGKIGPAPRFEDLSGTWETELVRDGTRLQLVLNILTTDQGTVATLDSISEAAYGIPVSNLSRKHDQVNFRVPAANVSFTGQLAENGDSIVGEWVRPGYPTTNLQFVKTSKTVEKKRRPQTPVGPYPYSVEDVTFENSSSDSVLLSGSLTVPEGDGPFPAVVFLSGSGPQDRDQSVWGHKPFLVLADHLTRRGVAVLRFDDRGVGGSTGDFAAADLDDFANDAVAAHEFLREHEMIDASRVGLLGHSEGGLIASLVGAQSSDVAFLILLAAPGINGDELLREQFEATSRMANWEHQRLVSALGRLEELHTGILQAEDRASARAFLDQTLTVDDLNLIGVPTDMRQAMINQFSHDWYRGLLEYQPAEYLTVVSAPVLALNGSLDTQVSSSTNLDAIRRMLSSNQAATVVELPGLNHLFQEAETGAMSEYAQIEETFSPLALEVIAQWFEEMVSGASLQ